MEFLDKEFFATFTEEVQEKLIDAISSAVETACDHYEDDRGNNATTFGVETYHCCAHELGLLAEDDPETFRFVKTGNLFRLYVGDFEIACHRVGGTETEDINSSFPNNDGAAHRMVEEQLFLPGVEQEKITARKFILSHFANPDDGLCAVYLCIPESFENQKITKWAYSNLFWKLDRGIEIPAGGKNKEHLPEPEKINDYKLRKRAKDGKTVEDEGIQ